MTKERKEKNYHAFRVPDFEQSLITSATNEIGNEMQKQAAVWRRIKVEDARQAKQKVKIEDKLAKIQESAMMSNVEKRKALMTPADKKYFGFI